MADFRLFAFIRMTALLALIAAVGLAQASELRTQLFAESDAIYRQAIDAKAGLLAPVSYLKAKGYYDRAQQGIEKNRSIERIQKDLQLADEFFLKAIAASKLSEATLASAIKARNDARNAEAPDLAADLWKRGEQQFLQATEEMETGTLARVKKHSEAAETYYRDAELTAIKNTSLEEIRRVIADAKKQKVSRYAPLTFEKSVALLASAEKELSENRYDTDYPRSLVKQALYEAKHAIYLADQVKSMRKGKLSNEQLLLNGEMPIAEIAEALDILPRFDQGYERVLGEIKHRLELLNNDSYELGEVRARLQNLEKDYAVLEKRLGIQSERLAEQERVREQMAMVDRLFEKEEAQVLTQQNNIILRVVGLSFAPGSAQVDTSNMNLLAKIQQVLSILDSYDVIIEGHTDAFGSDAANLVLSFDRATAIRDYFVANMTGFSLDRSEVKGYGENRPIASNETATGRQKNRRIDLVFVPRK